MRLVKQTMLSSIDHWNSQPFIKVLTHSLSFNGRFSPVNQVFPSTYDWRRLLLKWCGHFVYHLEKHSQNQNLALFLLLKEAFQQIFLGPLLVMKEAIFTTVYFPSTNNWRRQCKCNYLGPLLMMKETLVNTKLLLPLFVIWKRLP